MKKITIAIDGYSSTGKSTMAKQLAKSLGYIYVDTGAMYRAITLYALNKGYIGPDGAAPQKLVKDLPDIFLEFRFNKEAGFAEMYLNGQNVEKEIRTIEVSQYVSQIAVIKEVRQKLVLLQKEMGKNKGLVMDGRDIGTVVFPEAELKIFMTAGPDIRASRRYEELRARGNNVTYEEVLKNVEERDYIDSNREFSPLRKAADAVELDNSHLTHQEQFNRALAMAKRIIEKD